MEMGIPRERLFLEDRSTSTIENILFSHDIIEELSPGTKDFTIISSETHLYRACLAAQELGFIPSAFYAKTKKADGIKPSSWALPFGLCGCFN